MYENESPSYATTGKYSTTLFTDVAIDKINRHNTANPLFMYVAYTAPHAGNDYDPLQVPEEAVERFRYIADPYRRKYAAMVSVLDDSIGRIVQTIRNKGILHNSVIVLLADNGAPVQQLYHNGGSNFPFRGVSSFFIICFAASIYICYVYIVAKELSLGRSRSRHRWYLESVFETQTTCLPSVDAYFRLVANIGLNRWRSNSRTN